MRSENLKLLIQCFASVPRDGHILVRKCSGGAFITTYTTHTICNVMMNDEGWFDYTIRYSKLSMLKALQKEYKKDDTPDAEIMKLSESLPDELKDTNSVMEKAFKDKNQEFTINYKSLESVYKSMKKSSNILKLSISKNGCVAVVFNEEGDSSLIGLQRV